MELGNLLREPERSLARSYETTDPFHYWDDILVHDEDWNLK